MLAILLALLVMRPERAGIREALLLTVPPTLAYAFVCLAAWYPVRAMPLHRSHTGRLLATHGFAAIALSAVWVMLFGTWTSTLGAPLTIDRIAAIFVTGALLYLLSGAFHYLLTVPLQAGADGDIGIEQIRTRDQGMDRE